MPPMCAASFLRPQPPPPAGTKRIPGSFTAGGEIYIGFGKPGRSVCTCEVLYNEFRGNLRTAWLKLWFIRPTKTSSWTRKFAKWCEVWVFANVSSFAFEFRADHFLNPSPNTALLGDMKSVMIFHQSAFPYVQNILSEIPWAFSFNNSFPLTRVRARQVVGFLFCSVNLHGNLRRPLAATCPLRNSRPYYRFITHDDPLIRSAIAWGDGMGWVGPMTSFDIIRFQP